MIRSIRQQLTVFALALAISTTVFGYLQTSEAAAACGTTHAAPAYGQVNSTMTVSSGTYKVWSRIKIADTTNNSYDLQLVDNCTYARTISTTTVGSWVWVAGGVNFVSPGGSIAATMFGTKNNVQLDRVILAADTNCVPTGLGDNCITSVSNPPIVNMTAPATGTTVAPGASVALAATATPTTGAVTKVDFYNGTTLISTDTTSPYTATWTAPATPATYNLTAKATDADGDTATTTAVSVVVKAAGDTTVPTVSITAPASGSTVNAGAVVTISANAADNVGVSKVDFSYGTTLISTDTTSPYTASWTAPTTPGTYSLTAVAYDAAGNKTTSTAVSITVAAVPNGTGDINGDNRVNAIDLSSLISHDGQNFAPADLNHDGTVGAADLSIMLAHWTW